jgi:hypothetical protein
VIAPASIFSSSLRAMPLASRYQRRSSSKNTRDVRVSIAGSAASTLRSSYGTLITHCRSGTSGSTRSHTVAAVWHIRLPPHDGHTPRSLHENATGMSWPHPLHRALPKPWASTPQRRYPWNSSTTYRGSARPERSSANMRKVARCFATSACSVVLVGSWRTYAPIGVGGRGHERRVP